MRARTAVRLGGMLDPILKPFGLCLWFTVDTSEDVWKAKRVRLGKRPDLRDCYHGAEQ